MGEGRSFTEIGEREAESRDAASLVSTCVCGFRFEGSAAAGREAMRAHRRAAHPELPVAPTLKRKGRLQKGGATEEQAREAEARRLIHERRAARGEE